MSANPATRYARHAVDALVRAGVYRAIIAPGSRSTPLVMAFHEHPDVDITSLLDERSAAYFALGIALVSEWPVALVSSSGTATLNFHPAVVEARYAEVPLIVLTADRPHELRHSGANQTVDQVKQFGEHVLWSVDMPLPQADAPDVAIRAIRTTAARAVALSQGLTRGPVHLNFPFRKPLEPTPADARPLYEPELSVQPVVGRGVVMPRESHLNSLTEHISRHERGIIVCGPRSAGDDIAQVLTEFAHVVGWPILADPLSGLRFHPDVTPLGAYESFLGTDRAPHDVQAVLHLGAMPTGKAIDTYLDSITPELRLWVNPAARWLDPQHRADQLIQADPGPLLAALSAGLTPRTTHAWAQRWDSLEAQTWTALTQAMENVPFFDGAVMSAALDVLPDDAHLIIGNSLPVRHLDQFGQPRHTYIHTYGNRGASGIDGVTSTAIGIASEVNDMSEAPTVLITGDLSFYHDLNALAAIKRARVRNFSIVLVNNNGGGIFKRLPIAQRDPPFTDLFLTPHDLDFAPMVQGFGLRYQRSESADMLRRALRDSLMGLTPTVIEVPTDAARDHDARRRITDSVHARLKQYFA